MVEVEKVKLSQVAVNESNPRFITEDKLAALVLSILSFPKMLELRPIVVDETQKALGGNMRYTALNKIKGMTPSEIFDTLNGDDRFTGRTEGERQSLLDWWGAWRTEPFCYIVRGDMLSEEEKEWFIALDNISFGVWNWQKLTSKFPPMKLQKWGLDGVPNFTSLNNPKTGEPMNGEPNDNNSYVEPEAPDFNNLPSELAGINIEADEHDNIQGDDEVPYKRVIITYREDEAAAVASLLGVEAVDKVVYQFEELNK